MNRRDFELLGDRHKKYESLTETSVMPGLPVIIRLDGRAFHTFVRDLERPYDAGFSNCMINTAKRLVDKMHADIGYTQSDEISLGFSNPDAALEMAFGGRIQKLVSISAAIASVEFNKQVEMWDGALASKDPVFDSRIIAYPTEDLAAESFLWREADATRNSLAMAAQAHFPHEELEGKNRAQQHEMLFQKGVNWNDYPAFFKRGTYVRRGREERVLTQEELSRIPEEYRPKGPVTRGVDLTLDMPPVHAILNLAQVLFHGAEPVFETPVVHRTESNK